MQKRGNRITIAGMESTPKRRGGRRPVGPVTAIRLQPELKALIERWRITQPDRPDRSEAIRRLVLRGLSMPRERKE